ncbi:MAG TPA: hypothetical protein VH436_07430 [Vicinamibacterales bacterium]|jgi:hypothetical protein
MRRPLLAVCFALAITSAVPAQAPEPPLSDTRLTVHTLLREDVFAGFLQNDLARLARAEKNIDLLLASRPADRASILAWQGGTELTRAAQAIEAKQSDQFRARYRRAVDLFAEARKLGPTNVGVFAINGGSMLMLADRLPEKERGAAWEEAYAAYQQLWKMQGEAIDKLPLHHKGEVLTGLAQSTQRTGRDAELGPQLDRILTLLANTPYAKTAQQWKDNPASRAQSKLACQTCHGPGTLVARLAEVSKQ